MHPAAGPDIGIRKGDMIAEKYRVDRILGIGGMGVVVAARHLGLDELVAIKILLPEALADADAVRRFEREARSAVKIKSEHVTRIIDVGALDNGAPFIVMEYLAGEDLADRIARTGPLAVEDAIELMLQACEAIAEAHALGIVHRDLKPANLFCVRGPDGRTSIKVLDFGISKLTHAAAQGSGLGMTKTRAVMGSPYYMSPEQMESPRKVDERTDIWSLGVVLHQLLTGDIPFNGETMPQVCVNVATRPAPPLRKSRPDVPIGLEALALRCLEKDPSKRFPSVAALATALARFGSRRAQVSVDRIARMSRQVEAERRDSTAPLHATGASDRPVTGPLPSWGATAKSEGRRRSVIGGTIGVLVVISAGFAFALLESSTHPAAREVLITPPRTAETREVANGTPTSPFPGAPEKLGSPFSETAVAPDRAPPNVPKVSGGVGIPPSAPAAKLPPAGAPSLDSPRSTSPPPAAATPLLEVNPYAPSEPPNPTSLVSNCVLNLNSLPPARVLLDGTPLGFTPRVGLRVTAGEHHVLFKGTEGDKQVTVTCAKGETKTVGVRLDDPPSGDDLPEKNPYR
jgi:serine/threonine-protein kinase